MPRIPFVFGVLVGLAIGWLFVRGKQAQIARKQATEDAFESKMNARTEDLRKKLDKYKDEKRVKRLARWRD